MSKISVILPNYNYARYLSQRIETILNQTFSDFELIIIDDASTDSSIEIIKKYAKKDNRIKTVFNSKNSGNPFAQWKKGVDLAKGEYIWIAEADDYCENTLLEILYNKIEEYYADIAYCESNIIDENGVVKGKWSDRQIANNSIFKNDFEFEGHKFIEKYLIYANVIPNASAVLFRKNTYQKVGGVNENIKNCADWLLWLKTLYNGKVTYTAKPLNFFRRHDKSVISSIKDNIEENKDFHEYYSLSMRLFYDRILPKININKEIRKINNSYISKDLHRKYKWAIKRKKYIEASVYLLQKYLYRL